MRQPLVSILIPVFNAEKKSSESIHSALRQTWQRKEIIIEELAAQDLRSNLGKTSWVQERFSRWMMLADLREDPGILKNTANESGSMTLRDCFGSSPR